MGPWSNWTGFCWTKDSGLQQSNAWYDQQLFIVESFFWFQVIYILLVYGFIHNMNPLLIEALLSLACYWFNKYSFYFCFNTLYIVYLFSNSLYLIDLSLIKLLELNCILTECTILSIFDLNRRISDQTNPIVLLDNVKKTVISVLTFIRGVCIVHCVVAWFIVFLSTVWRDYHLYSSARIQTCIFGRTHGSLHFCPCHNKWDIWKGKQFYF